MAVDHERNGPKPVGEEEIRKDAIMRAAETLLKQVDPEVSFEWVRSGEVLSAVPGGTRRIVQVRG